MGNFQRKTQRGSTLEDVMEKAMKAVQIQKRPCREVAKEYSIPHVTLRRYCLKYREEHSDQTDDMKEISLKRYGYFNNKSLFDSTQELFLVEYLLKSSAKYCGLSTSEVKSFAYEYAITLDLKISSSWDEA